MSDLATSALVNVAVHDSEEADHQGVEYAGGVSAERIDRWEASGRVTPAEAAAGKALLAHALDVKAQRVDRQRRAQLHATHAAEAGEKKAAEGKQRNSVKEMLACAHADKLRFYSTLRDQSLKALVVHDKRNHYFDWTEEGFSKQQVHANATLSTRTTLKPATGLLRWALLHMLLRVSQITSNWSVPHPDTWRVWSRYPANPPSSLRWCIGNGTA